MTEIIITLFVSFALSLLMIIHLTKIIDDLRFENKILQLDLNRKEDECEKLRALVKQSRQN